MEDNFDHPGEEIFLSFFFYSNDFECMKTHFGFSSSSQANPAILRFASKHSLYTSMDKRIVIIKKNIHMGNMCILWHV